MLEVSTVESDISITKLFGIINILTVMLYILRAKKMGCTASRVISAEPPVIIVPDSEIAAETKKYNQAAPPMLRNRWNLPKEPNSKSSDENLDNVVKLCGI